MALADTKPLLIYDGIDKLTARPLAQKFVANGWCKRMVRPAAFAKQKTRGENVIVIGAFSERDAEAIFKKPKRAIFINPFDMARPDKCATVFSPMRCLPIRVLSCR